MDANKVLKSDFLDILFDGKNKEYGAYELRKTYNSRMVKAMLGTGAFLLLLFVLIENLTLEFLLSLFYKLIDNQHPYSNE